MMITKTMPMIVYNFNLFIVVLYAGKEQSMSVAGWENGQWKLQVDHGTELSAIFWFHIMDIPG